MTRSARAAWWGAAASAGATLSLTPLVVGSGWLVGALGTVLAVVGTGLVVRAALRREGLAVAAQAVVLLALLVAQFGGSTAVLGVLPSGATPGRLVQLFAEGVQVVQRYSVPAADLRGLRLLLVGGAGLIALAVDAAAVPLRRPALAGVPLAAALAVPLALAPGGSGVLALLVTAVPYLVLLTTSRSDPRWPAPGRAVRAAVRRPSGTRAGTTATATAAGALALALVVPALAPGLDERPLTLNTGSGDTITVINPILNLKASLGARSDATILTYQTDQEDPAPLRIVTADVFDGETWAPSTGADIPRNQRVQDGMSPPPGLSQELRASSPVHTTTISVRGLDQTYLPLPYPSLGVAIDGEWLYERETLNVVGDGETTRNRGYVARHLEVDPVEEQLRTAGAAPEEVRERYTALPESLPAVVREEAARVTADARDDYERAAALQRWFRSTGGFTYSTSAPNDGGADAVAAFLEQRSGFCVQFASAMAVMARALDIPARVAIGFLPGEQTSPGNWRITPQDAHAWPELYFEGMGWVRFEPTPATRTGQSPAYTVPAVRAPGGGAVPDLSSGGQDERQPSASAAPSASATASAPGEQAEEAELTGWQRVAAAPWGWVAAALLLVLALVAPRAGAAAVGRRRWRAAHDGPSSAEAAWAELEDRLADLGLRWPVSATPRRRAALVEDFALLPTGAREQLTALRAAVEGARFGAGDSGGGPGPAGGAGRAGRRGAAVLERPASAAGGRRVVRAQVDEVVGAVAESCSRAARWRARWFPGAGVRALLAWWERD
ncbi:transglutaminaseTgpA domain-containing protein [Kineococcus gypseus]|uniref:transglutaminase family protein n=1 Tax=Kineococcus gypseus TaxID=1637102 RepID=UPI003D7C81CB